MASQVINLLLAASFSSSEEERGAKKRRTKKKKAEEGGGAVGIKPREGSQASRLLLLWVLIQKVNALEA